MLFLGLQTSFGEKDTDPVRFGIKGGGGIKFLWGIEDKKEESGLNLLLQGGTLLRIKPWEVFGVQLEVNYVRKGGELTRSDMDQEYEKTIAGIDSRGGTVKDTGNINNILEIEATYVQVPLLFKLFAPGYKVNSPNMFMGGYYSYLLNGKETKSASILGGTSVTALSESNVEKIGIKPPDNGVINKHDYGLIMGLGIDFGLGTFDVRMEQAFNTLYDKGWDYRAFSMTANIGFLVLEPFRY